MAVAKAFWVLIGIAVALSGWRIATGQADLDRFAEESEYDFDFEIEIRSSAGPFDLAVFIPHEDDAVLLRTEEISAGDLDLVIEESAEGKQLRVKGTRSDLPTRVQFRTRIARRPIVYDLTSDLDWSHFDFDDNPDSNELTPVSHPEIDADLLRLFDDAVEPGTSFEGAAPASIRDMLGQHGVGPIEAIDRIHDRCLNGLRSADFSGRTSALTALRLGEASCGGKTRLMVTLLRRLGFRSRLIGGVILGDSNRKRTSHIWTEILIGDQWVPFDPLNGYRAELPAHYLHLYTGESPLIRFSRGLAFDYGFRAPLERVPREWVLAPQQNASSGAFPLLRRDQFSLILLAPFALLMTVFLRQVVGIQSIGVFLPVLLGFCVTQVGWSMSGLLMLLTMILGVSVRMLTTRFGLLHVPRAAFMITFVVLIFLTFTVSMESFGFDAPRGVLVLPMAALAMTVERFTVDILDRGVRDAVSLLLQTIILAMLSALVLMQPMFKVLTVSFPEVLLVVLAEIMMVGRYRGLRLVERWRFGAIETDAS